MRDRRYAIRAWVSIHISAPTFVMAKISAGIATRERYGVVEPHRLAERPEAEAPDASSPSSRRAGALALLLAVCGHSAQ